MIAVRCFGNAGIRRSQKRIWRSSTPIACASPRWVKPASALAAFSCRQDTRSPDPSIVSQLMVPLYHALLKMRNVSELTGADKMLPTLKVPTAAYGKNTQIRPFLQNLHLTLANIFTLSLCVTAQFRIAAQCVAAIRYAPWSRVKLP